jgi:hypothetical protein
VLEALEARGIPVIVLKRAALAETVYGCSSLRPMTGLDLLVRHEDADAADSIIRGMGYVPSVSQEVQEEMASATASLPDWPRLENQLFLIFISTLWRQVTHCALTFPGSGSGPCSLPLAASLV